MIGAERWMLIGCLLHGAMGRDWAIWMPQSIEALSGSCVLIPCTFDMPSKHDEALARDPSSVSGQWLRDGVKVFDSRSRSDSSLQGRITGDLLQKNCTTVMENIPINYAGPYYFRLEGDHLRFSLKGHSAQINIRDSPPKPNLTPEVVEVLEGTSVNLSCSAFVPCPDLPPNLSWTPRLGDSVDQLQENDDRTKSASSVLTFTASHLHHGKKITCRARYTLQQGETLRESTLTLRVQYPPKNTSVSVSPSASVLAGSSVTLTCRSDANPAVQNYTWYKVNGTERNAVGTGQNLTFTVTESSQGEQYYCEAENGHGKENSATVHLEVYYPPKNTSVSVSPSGSVLAGSSVTLTCRSDANPAVQNYTWYKVNGTETNAVGTGQNLTFTVTESSNGEQYYCEAENGHGKENSATVQLEAYYPPKNTSVSVSPSGSVLAGSSVTLSCRSDANPAVQNYTWYKVNGTEMNAVGTGQNLTFTVTESSQGEQYYCEAENGHGKENSATVQLNVTYVPQISGSGSCSRSAEEISCSCESRGNPSPSLEWHVSGLRVTNSTDRVIREEQLGNTGLRSSLTVRQSQGDTPTLLCISTNTVGSSSLQFHLSSPRKHSGFGVTSLLIAAAAAGAGAALITCLIMQLILKKQRDSQCSRSRMKNAEGLTLTDETADRDEEPARRGAAGRGDEGALHYATVDFSKLAGRENRAGVIRGASSRTTEYAEIRHKSREEREGRREGGQEAREDEEEEEEEEEEEGERAEPGAGSSESAGARGRKEAEPRADATEEEEATYGNIMRPRPVWYTLQQTL